MLLRKPRFSHSQLTDLEAGPNSECSAQFVLEGVLVKARLTKTGMLLTPLETRRCWPLPANLPSSIPFSEILCVATSHSVPSWRRCRGLWRTQKVTHRLTICTFRRPRLRQCHWVFHSVELESQEEDVVRRWAADINEAVNINSVRPKTLLVFLNPFGGSGRAPAVWARDAAPILSKAGVRCKVVVTERPLHAYETVRDLALLELESYDGILAVGGDGMFQELLNGVMALRSCEEADRAAAAAQLRLGHIPGGSTDAVAYSLNGTRSAVTAALHVALGDRTPLDVMRVDTADGSYRFSVCYATYGYMGDLLRTSESLRWSKWLGEQRYPLAGALTLLRGRSYHACVSYIPSTPGISKRVECTSQCHICAEATGAPAGDTSMHSSTPSEGEPAWTVIEGEFKSIMAIVTPCRSDMSAGGLARTAHLSDGRLKLVFVRRCSVLQYLRLLARIPTLGIDAEHDLPFVTVLDVVAVAVKPIGPESSWNVDGELMPSNHLSARVHRGAVQVFSRGVE
ncbi:Ceramide kinase [Coccomyxa sp. Obi]|nr:Ceramide kinase [Coccomyxa sp. Obi]